MPDYGSLIDEMDQSNSVQALPENVVNPLAPNKEEPVDYLKRVDELDENQAIDVNGAMIASANKNPDEQAEYRRLSKELNLPMGFVERNYSTFKEKSMLAKLDPDELVKTNPGVAKYLADVDNALIARDDTDALKKIEDKAKDSFARNLIDGFKSGAMSLMSGIAKSPALMYGEAHVPYFMEGSLEAELMRQELKAGLPEKPPEFIYKNAVTKFLDRKAEEYRPQVMNKHLIEEWGKGNYETAAKNLAVNVAANMPQLALLVATRGKSMPLLYASTAGDKLATELEKGTELEKAKAAARLYGAAEVGIESLGGIGTSAFHETVKSTVNAIGKKGAVDAFAQAFRTIGKQAGEEGLEEAVTTLAQKTVDYGMLDDKAAYNNLLTEMAESAILGGASGGAMTSFSLGSQTAFKSFEDRSSAVQYKDGLMAINEAVQKESKLAKRSPEAMRDFIEHAVEGTDLKNVYIPVQSFETFLQEKGLTPTAVANDLGILEQYKLAQETESDIKVPLSTYIDKVGKTEFFQGLSDHAKSSPDAKTLAELKKESDEARQELSSEQQAAKEASKSDEAEAASAESMANEIGKGVSERLKEIGVNPKEAGHYSRLYSNAFYNLSKRTGVSPVDLINRYGLQIGGKYIVQPGEVTLNDKTSEFYQMKDAKDVDLSVEPESLKVNSLPLSAAGYDITKQKLEKLHKKGDVIFHSRMPINPRIDINGILPKQVDQLQTGEKFTKLDNKIATVVSNIEKVFANSMLMKIKDAPTPGDTKNLYFYSPVSISGKDYVARMQVLERMVGESKDHILNEVILEPVRKEKSGIPTAFTDNSVISEASDGAPATLKDKNSLSISKADFINNVKNIRKENVLFQTKTDMSQADSMLSPIGFYSQVEAEISKMDFKSAPAKDIANRLKNIQGLKKEELDYLGVFDFLKTKEDAGEKITKEDLLAFVKENGLHVEQVVLGKLPSANIDDSTQWGDSPKFSEPEFVPPDDDRIIDLLDSNWRDRLYEINKGRDDDFNEKLAEKIAEAKQESEDGEIDEEQIKEDLIEQSREAFEETETEYLQSEDAGFGEYKIEEETSGETLEGSDDNGWRWYNGRKTYEYHEREDEAKIQWLNDLYEQEALQRPVTKPAIGDYGFSDPEITVEKDKFNELEEKIKSTDEYKAKEAELLKEISERVAKQEEERVSGGGKPFLYETLKSSIDRQLRRGLDQYISNKMDEMVSAEDGSADYVYSVVKPDQLESYDEGFELNISGNNKSGWKIEYGYLEDGRRRYDHINLGSGSTIDQAKARALQVIQEIGYAYKPTEASASDKYAEVNKVQDKAKWKNYSVIGGDTYKEILLTLPKIGPDKFSYTTHFNQKNFVAHARMSDTEIDGKKTLFIEEIQSDWHQQGRERGYKDGQFSNQVKELVKKYDALWADKANRENNAAEREKLAEEFNAVMGETDLKIGDASKDIEKLDEAISQAQSKSVPDAPFKQTDAWTALVMKRLIRLAAEQGYEKVAWTPAKVHYTRWGTESVGWKKSEGGFRIIAPEYEEAKKTVYKTKAEAEENLKEYGEGATIEQVGEHFIFGGTEQSGGEADGMNIEEMARARGDLLEKNGERIFNKEDLRAQVTDLLNRERSPRSLNALTERIWKMMQENGEGEIKPRKEGMEFFYDKMVPDVTKKILSKLDKESKIKVLDVPGSSDGFEGKALGFDLTDKIKEKVLTEGFSLFQDKKGPLGKIEVGTNSINIELLKGADRSTFIHETGHFYLEVIKDLYNSDKATDQMKADMKSVLDWMNVSSVEEIGVDQHEMFARGFEQYLMSGEAPSKGLRKAFANFKTWLIDLYKTLANLDVTVTPEVKDVFDRLLATDEQIEEAHRTLEVKQVFDDPSKIGMSEADQYKYNELMYWAKAEAKEILTKKLMVEVEKKQSSEYKDKYKSIFDEEMKLAEEKIEFKVLSEIAKPEMKLSKPVMEKYYSVFKGYIKPTSMKVDGGLHPDFVASLFGFENGQAMLQAIAPFHRGIKWYVEQQTATRMIGEYPELLQSPELSEEAIKAYHNDNYKQLKKFELEWLAKADPKMDKKIATNLIKRLPNDKSVKLQAEGIIAKEKVGELKPHTYRNAEKRLAKETAANYKKGEYALAFESKRKELLNFYLYDEAYTAKEEVAKSVKDFKKFFKSDEDMAKTRDMNLVNAGRAILAAYGITRADKTAAEYLEPMKQYDPDIYQAVMPLIEEALKFSGSASTYQGLTYDQFIGMRDTVNSIFDLARSSREIEIDGKLMQKEAIKAELTEKVEKFTADKPQDEVRQTLDNWGVLKNKLLSARASLVRMEHLADLIDIDFGGPFRRYVWQPISDATVKYRLEKKTVLEKYRALLDQYKESFSDQPIEAKELGFKFRNKAELLMAVLHSGNESNLQKLLRGYGWGAMNEDGTLDRSRWDSFRNRMYQEGIINKADMDLAQGVWDLLEGLKPVAQKAHKKMYGHYFSEITAQEIETPFGKYRGGYIPAKVDINTVEDGAIRAERQAFEENNNSYQYPTAGRGFTKSRVDAYAAPLSLDMNLLGGHIDGVLRFAHIEPRVKEIARLFMDKEFRATMAKVDPTITKDAIIPWLQRTATQKVVLPSQDGLGRLVDTVAKFIRGNVGRAIMFGNITNSLQQFTGLSVAMVKVKPRFIRNALAEYVAGPKSVGEYIVGKSEWMKSAQGSNLYETHQAINEIITNPSTFDNIKNFSKSHAYFLQTGTQNIVNTVVWLGAYNQAAENNMNELESVRFADAAVRETQGSLSPEDISRFETGTPTELMFKQFVGYFNMLANLNASELIKTSRAAGFNNKYPRAFYVYMMGIAMPAFLSEMIVMAMSGKGIDQDDDDSYLDDLLAAFFGSQTKTVIATVPYAGQAMIAGYNSFNNKPMDDRVSLSPAIATLETVVGVPAAIYKSATKEEISKKTVKDTLSAISFFSGVPIAPLGKPIGYLMDVESGKARPQGPVDYGRGLVTGRSGQ